MKQRAFPAGKTIGIITYDHPHLKTEQLVHGLTKFRYNRNLDLKLIAFPFKPRQERSVLFSHRPEQSASIPTRELANRNDLEFILFDSESDLIPCNYYLIAGAGILPKAVVQGRTILNAHPGIIPSVRGLDAFKWAIYLGLPLGVTLHYIDTEVDAGEIVKIVNTPIYPSDTLETLARRHYELELDLLVHHEYHCANRDVPIHPEHPPHMRMPKTTEEEMLKRFDSYKCIFCGDDRRTLHTSVPATP